MCFTAALSLLTLTLCMLLCYRCCPHIPCEVQVHIPHNAVDFPASVQPGAVYPHHAETQVPHPGAVCLAVFYTLVRAEYAHQGRGGGDVGPAADCVMPYTPCPQPYPNRILSQPFYWLCCLLLVEAPCHPPPVSVSCFVDDYFRPSVRILYGR